MSEEIPFRSIKITLSEEALAKLANLRINGYFRSDSATVEECIRAIYDVAEDLASEVERHFRIHGESAKNTPISLELQAEELRRISFRLVRFTPKIKGTEAFDKKVPSAGT